jgi:hypothetical protein
VCWGETAAYAILCLYFKQLRGAHREAESCADTRGIPHTVSLQWSQEVTSGLNLRWLSAAQTLAPPFKS